MTFFIRVDLGLALAVFLALIIFGIGYNVMVAWLERKHYSEGFESLIVTTGVFATLIGVAILSIEGALLVLACFIASGLPMIIGSIIRYMTKRAAHIDAIKQGEL
jgi:hypothetical protein